MNPLEKKIILNTFRGVRCISRKDIVYCKASGNYTDIYIFNAQNKKDCFTTQKTILQMGELFKGCCCFFRCHKSYMINLFHFQELDTTKNEILLQNGDIVKLSRLKKNEFMVFLDNYVAKCNSNIL